MLHVDVTPGALDLANTLGRCKHRLPNNSTTGCYRAGHLGFTCCMYGTRVTNSLAEAALQTSFQSHNDSAHPVDAATTYSPCITAEARDYTLKV